MTAKTPDGMHTNDVRHVRRNYHALLLRFLQPLQNICCDSSFSVSLEVVVIVSGIEQSLKRPLSSETIFQTMPHDPGPPPAKKFKPGSVFFRLDKNKPVMLLTRKENATSPLDIQRKQLPIYQAKLQLLNQLRTLHSAILIGQIPAALC